MTEPGAEGQKQSPWWLALRVVDEPAKVFRQLASSPTVLVPIVFLAIVTSLQAFATPAEVLREQTRQQLETFTSGDLTEEQEQTFAERIERSGSTTGRLMVVGFGIPAAIVSFLVVALVLMLIFGATSADPIRFKQELAIVTHAFMVQLLGVIVVTSLMIAGLTDVKLSLGFLVSSETSPFLNRVAEQVTLFGAWNVYLLALGNQVLTKAKGIGTALGIIGGLWLLLKVAFAAVGGLFGG